MRKIVLATALIAACAKSITGPAPEVTAVAPDVVCTEQFDNTLAVTGERFSPLPTGLLTPAPGVAIPQISAGTAELQGEAFSDIQDMSGVLQKQALTPGVYDIGLVNPNGRAATLAGALTVVPPPDVTEIAPDVSCTEVARAVTITGTKFRTTPDLWLVTPGANFDLTGETLNTDGTSVAATVPAGAPEGGPYDLVLKNPEGCIDTLPAAFTVVPPPDALQVVPTASCTDLARTVTVTGTKFRAVPELWLVAPGGNVDLTGETMDAGGTSVTATVPAGAPVGGPYDLVVKNPEGCIDTLVAAFTVAPPPDVTGVAPPSGVNTSATAITISGTGFIKEGAVQPAAAIAPNGGGAATDLTGETWSSDTSVGASVPAGLAPGMYDLTLTNPEGCSDTLANAFEVTPPPIIDVVGVTPAFGWIGSRTTIQISATNANGKGLVPVPEAFLLVDPDGDGQDVTEVPLIREAFLAQGSTVTPFTLPSVMSAVVPAGTETRGAGLVVGGPYDVKVVSPIDGAVGIIPGAFTLLADPPPVIVSINPEQHDNQTATTLTVTGSNFKDPATTLNPRVARVLLLTANMAPGGTCTAPGCYECANPVRTGTGASTSIACSAPTNAGMTAGAYVVRVEHLDDASFADFGFFAVTNPAGNLATATTAMPALFGGPRMSHGAAFGRDDLGNRFLYAVGGRSGTNAGDVLDTVEALPLPLFAAPSAWATLPVKLPRKLEGLALAQQGPYLFAIGGRDDAGALRTEIYRARILGADSAPEIGAPSAGAGGSLAAGTYYYKVAAVMGAGTDNAGGETLPSDEESARAPASGTLTLAWQAVPGADKYRIYRSEQPDQISNTEVFLTEEDASARCTGSDCTFPDDGTDTVDAARLPRPVGSTGEWMAMTALPADRTDAAAAIAQSPDGTRYLFVLGGRSNAGVENTALSVPLVVTAGVVGLGTFGTATAMPVKRAEATAATLSSANAPALLNKNTNQYLLVSNGITDTGATNTQIHSAKVDNGGLLAGGWSLRDNSASYKRYGHVAVLTNNFYFTIGGRDTGVLNKGQTAVVSCTAAPCDPPPVAIQGGDSGITLTAARYRAALIYEAGFFYFIGGSSDGTAPIASVERGGYQ